MILVLPQAQPPKESDPPILLEAEEFTPTTPGWERKPYGANYSVGTFANTFLSRKAFLGAPEQGPHTQASMDVKIPAAGTWSLFVRYEAAWRFETRFRVLVEQEGKFKLDRLFGARENEKIWAFGKKKQKELAWDWGATENIVWEGCTVELEAGTARILLTADGQPEPAARRNVDLVLLTRDHDGVKRRIERENYLPLDGLLTQAGDLFLKVHNTRGGGPLTLHVPPGTEHSPYWVHLREWKPKTVTAKAGQSSDWVEVGSLLDSLNDGQWALSVREKSPSFDLEFGVPGKTGEIESIRRFENLTGGITLAYDADTRRTRRIRSDDQVLYELLDDLRRDPVRGRPPTRTLIYGYTFDPRPNDARYSAALREFVKLMGATALSKDGDEVTPEGLIRGTIDVRGQDAKRLEESCAKLVADGRAAKIACVSLGDEISLPLPPAEDHPGFRAWLHEIGLKPSDVDPDARDDWDLVKYNPKNRERPGVYYYSRLYGHRFGIRAMKALTDVLRSHLPNAGIGANYSPHHAPMYLGETHKWVSLFREGGMTMPWSEDYIFQVPVATQQMNFLSLDLFRAGVKGDRKAKIHFYVMPHWPGNTPASWRRQFYGDLAHGAQILNLFEFRPVQAAYTENHVSLPAMYREIRRSFHELGTFEDIVQDGRVRTGTAGLWFSETGDVWDDAIGSFAAGKRCLYIMARHQQLALDVVTDGDGLADYKVLFLADAHVSRPASRAIDAWVRAGGRLFATAGAGMFDELNEPNVLLRKLMGVDFRAFETAPEPVLLEKQDIPFARPVDLVSLGAAKVPALGAVARIVATDAEVHATFEDRSPAVTVRAAGKGRAVTCAFLPGLSYFRPGLPRRPVDRGHAEDSMAHFIPAEFDRAVSDLVATVANVDREVLCTEPLVESSVIESPHGTAIPLISWAGRPLKDVMLIVRLKIPQKEATMASGNPVRVAREADGSFVFTFDLEAADALILR